MRHFDSFGPFLCEFCDIRVLPDNNRAHIKPARLIIDELDELYDLGVRQCLFACDNFIGDIQWALEVCDQIIKWKEQTGKKLSLYTWLTINVSRTPRLLKKLRQAGFDMFFIGIESFHQTSLLETAKIQNAAHDLVGAIREIQSYGFIVVAGLIFGFDTDPANVADLALEGIVNSGLISGDPSLLTALPGTPLYQRMQLSDRLREGKLGLGGFKYQTNIRYLKQTSQIRDDFRKFVKHFNEGSFQLARLTAFFDCLDSTNYVVPETQGYANLRKMFTMVFREGKYVRLLIARIFSLIRSPIRDYYILKAFATTMKRSSSEKPLWFYFKVWLFTWSNSLVKYSNLSESDFDIESVRDDFHLSDLVPLRYEEEHPEAGPSIRVEAQRRLTVSALKEWMTAESTKQAKNS